MHALPAFRVVRAPRRGLPAFGAVGEECRRECPHRRNHHRSTARFGIADQHPHRVPSVLNRQRIERAERPLDNRAVAAPVHDLRLASVRSRPQSEFRCRHALVKTTERYVHLSDQSVADAAGRVSNRIHAALAGSGAEHEGKCDHAQG